MEIIKVPTSQGSLGKNKGCETAPGMIINALKEIYTNENGFDADYKIDSIDTNNSDLDKTNKNIYEKIKDTEKGIILGGDHSITYPAFKAFSKRGNCGLIVFDAHPDVMEGTDIPTHEDYLRKLIDEEILKPDKLYLIGLRNGHISEYQYLKQKKIRYFSSKKISFEGIQDICDSVMENTKEWQHLYVSIDIDVLDAAFAPGTGYPEVGGFSTRELLYFLQRLKNLKNLEMIDLVEVNPKKDIADLTVKTAAKIVKEFL